MKLFHEHFAAGICQGRAHGAVRQGHSSGAACLQLFRGAEVEVFLACDPRNNVPCGADEETNFEKVMEILGKVCKPLACMSC